MKAHVTFRVKPPLPTRLCSAMHISDPKWIFLPTQVAVAQLFQPVPFGHPRFIRSFKIVWRAGSAVLRCPLTCAVNGQQHSSSCFVCNSQYHGLVQGGAAPAPATSGLALARARARLLPPPPPGHSAFPPFPGTKEMRIAPVIYIYIYIYI
jgi:hypothetical protein